MGHTLRISLFFTVTALLVSLLALHVHRRATRTLGLPRRAGHLFAALMALGVSSAFAARTIASGELARWLGTFGAGITLGVIISSVLLWPYELWRAAVALVSWLKRVIAPGAKGSESTPEPATSTDAQLEAPARREFLAQAAVGSALSIGFGSASYGAFFGRHDYSLDSVAIKLDKLPRELDGFTIVQLSDIHVGLYVSEYELAAGLELVKKAKPDIVVLTGDLVDHDPTRAPELGRFARRLRDVARYGVFAIPGNHDYYAGVEPVLQALREAGSEVLVNRHVLVGDQKRFALAGSDELTAQGYGGAGPRLDEAFRHAPPELARVLLSHNPAHYPVAHQHADLMLSGHTHGGQITLFINPAEVVLRHGYVRGHYLHGESQLYVNRGFGTAGPPARVGSPPEVTRIILTSA